MATAHLHQRHTKKGLGPIEQIPGMTIGNIGPAGGVGELAGIEQPGQQHEQHRIKQLAILAIKTPGRGDVQLFAKHFHSYFAAV
jgi:hypothetical protein